MNYFERREKLEKIIKKGISLNSIKKIKVWEGGENSKATSFFEKGLLINEIEKFYNDELNTSPNGGKYIEKTIKELWDYEMIDSGDIGANIILFFKGLNKDYYKKNFNKINSKIQERFKNKGIDGIFFRETADGYGIVIIKDKHSW